MTKRASLFIIAVFFTVCIPVLASAADYLPKNKAEGGNVTVAGDKEYKNLFVGGGTVAINKEILGDLFAAGSSVNVASPVEKDLFVAGGNVTVSAAVGDDARLAGGNISVSAPVQGDLMIAGGTINISQAATVGGDFWTGAGALNVNSNIKGNVKIAGGEILINGEIGGNVEIRANKKLVFGPQSKVLGKIVYWGTSEAVIQDGAEVSKIEFYKIEQAQVAGKLDFLHALGIFFLIKVLVLFVTALAVTKLFGKTSHVVVSRPHAKPWVNLGIGILGMIVTPIAIVILFVTILGSLAGLISLFWFIATLLFSSVFVVLFIGSLLERWLFKKKEVEVTWKTAAWGVVASAIASLIPVVGWLAVCIVYLMVFGSLLQEAKARLEI